MRMGHIFIYYRSLNLNRLVQFKKFPFYSLANGYRFHPRRDYNAVTQQFFPNRIGILGNFYKRFLYGLLDISQYLYFLFFGYISFWLRFQLYGFVRYGFESFAGPYDYSE